MKTGLLLGILMSGLFVWAGCTDREAEASKMKADADAKARAEAARKEMEALPKAFKSPQFFKLNEPEKKTPQSPVPDQPHQQNP